MRVLSPRPGRTRLVATLCALLVAGSLGAGSLAAADLSGRWTATIEREGEKHAYFFDLVQRRESISGALVSPRSGRHEFRTGSFKSGTLSVEIDRKFGDDTVTLELEGKASGADKIAATLSANGNQLAELALVRLPTPVGTWDVKSYSPDGEREFLSQLVIERSAKGLVGKSSSERGSAQMKLIAWKSDKLHLKFDLEVNGTSYPIELDLAFTDKNTLQGKWKGSTDDGTEFVGDWGAVRKVAPAAKKEYQLQADQLFDRSHVVDVKIEIPASDWDELRSQTRDFPSAFGKELMASPFTYFRGNVTVDGVRVEGVGIRKKGFLGSLDEDRPSLKVKFSEYSALDPIEGLDRLTLNNNKQDDSLASQFLTYKIFAAAGVHAPRCNFAHVVVNGESLGIYSNVEPIKKAFLRRQFEDGSGQLFEGTLADFITERISRFEAKNTAAETNRDVLANIAKTLAAEGDVAINAIATHVDIDAFLKFWAVESLISFWDGYASNQNNYFVYENPKNSKLYWIPWGADSVFTNPPPILMLPRGPKSVYANAHLPYVLFRHEATQKRYRETLEAILASAWNEKSLLAELDGLPALVGDRLHPMQAKNFPKALARTRRFIEERRERLAEELAEWPPDTPSKRRQPPTMEQVGTARVTFETTWFDNAPKDISLVGKAELEMTLNGKKVEFAKVGVYSGPGQLGFGDAGIPGKRRPPAVVFYARRKSGRKTTTIAIGVSALRFRPTSGESIPLAGMVIEEGGFFGSGFRFANGSVKFEKASEEDGAPVVGSAEIEIFRMRSR